MQKLDAVIEAVHEQMVEGDRKFDMECEIAKENGLPMPKSPKEKKFNSRSDMTIRIIVFVKNPPKNPPIVDDVTRLTELYMLVKQETKIREVKDFVLTEINFLHYYQLEVFYWRNNSYNDSMTIEEICNQTPFLCVRIFDVYVEYPGMMFRNVYQTFIDIGMNDEMALKQTESFLKTYQNVDPEHDEADKAWKIKQIRAAYITLKKILPNEYSTTWQEPLKLG